MAHTHHRRTCWQRCSILTKRLNFTSFEITLLGRDLIQRFFGHNTTTLEHKGTHPQNKATSKNPNGRVNLLHTSRERGKAPKKPQNAFGANMRVDGDFYRACRLGSDLLINRPHFSLSKYIDFVPSTAPADSKTYRKLLRLVDSGLKD